MHCKNMVEQVYCVGQWLLFGGFSIILGICLLNVLPPISPELRLVTIFLACWPVYHFQQIAGQIYIRYWTGDASYWKNKFGRYMVMFYLIIILAGVRALEREGLPSQFQFGYYVFLVLVAALFQLESATHSMVGASKTITREAVCFEAEAFIYSAVVAVGAVIGNALMK